MIVVLCIDVKQAPMSAGHACLHAVHMAHLLETTACRAPGCRKPFSFLLRPRHHCRACGLLFCGACCSGAPAAVLPCSCCEAVGPVYTVKLALGSIRRLPTFTRLAACPARGPDLPPAPLSLPCVYFQCRTPAAATQVPAAGAAAGVCHLPRAAAAHPASAGGQHRTCGAPAGT